jgi:hypothetical protein
MLQADPIDPESGDVNIEAVILALPLHYFGRTEQGHSESSWLIRLA